MAKDSVVIRQVTLDPIHTQYVDSEPMARFEAQRMIREMRARRSKGDRIVHGLVEVH